MGRGTSNNSGPDGGLQGHPQGKRYKRELAKVHSSRSKLGKRPRKHRRINRRLLTAARRLFTRK